MIKCAHCGKEFEPKTKTAKFCSKECNQAVHRPRMLFEKIKCACCGKKFMPKTGNAKFCSMPCKRKVNNANKRAVSALPVVYERPIPTCLLAGLLIPDPRVLHPSAKSRKVVFNDSWTSQGNPPRSESRSGCSLNNNLIFME